MSDGTRRITHVTELTGAYTDVISMQDIFRLREGRHRGERQG